MLRPGATLLAAVGVATACHAPVDAAETGRPRPALERPTGCHQVEPGEDVQQVLDAPGVSAVCLAPGLHLGPLRLDRAVTLWGPPEAVVHARRPGSAIVIRGDHVALLGLTIDGTGGRFDQADAAVHVVSARDVRIEGVAIVNGVFGISVEQSARVRVLHNEIQGSRDPAIGLRGDTIRLWETRDSRVEGNVIADGRDILIWYARDNTIVDNHVEGGRYGFHFMYSHDSSVSGNQVLHAVVGVFAMYSRGIAIRGNVIGGATGAAGMGIGLKESGNLEVTENRLIRNTTGIYIDASPLQLADHLLIARNELRLNERAIVFHASAHRVTIRDNDFIDNPIQAVVDGGGDARDASWRRNHFDDYAGYDLDGDGIGDVAYELRSLSNQLTATTPNLALFRGTLALALVDAATHLDPLYQPRSVLVDPEPRLEPRPPPSLATRTTP